MSKTNTAVIWIDGQIAYHKQQIARLEQAREIMVHMTDTAPTTKTEVALAAVPKASTMKWVDMVGPHSVLPSGAGNRADMIVRLLRAGPLTSGMLIERLGCKTKQDKQMIYAALNTMKREKIVTQYEDSRRYKLS